MGRRIALVGVVAFGALGLSACATEKYVDQHIATVNDRVAALEGRVQAVDGKADSAAGAAQSANQRLDQLTSRVDSIEQQLAEQRARGKKPRN
jgi:outer membrane murein-binding lipoprotein Lpp